MGYCFTTVQSLNNWVDDGFRPPFGNILLPHSGPGRSPAAAIHGGFSLRRAEPFETRITPSYLKIELFYNCPVLKQLGG
jgi:hypothetical protein